MKKNQVIATQKRILRTRNEVEKYVAVLFISPIGFFEHLNIHIKRILSFIFLAGFCLATYHAFVQMGWIEDRCAMTQKIDNLADFMNMLDVPKNEPCAKISLRLFGISASIYNATIGAIALTCLNRNLLKTTK